MRTGRALAALLTALIAVTSLHVLLGVARFISASTVELSPTIPVSAGDTVSIELPALRRGDRVYVVLDGRVNVDDIRTYPVEAVQLPLRVETFDHDVFPTLVGERRYMFVVREDSDRAFLSLRLQRLTPYVIKSIEGYQEYRVLGYCGERVVCVGLTPLRFHVNGYSQLAFIFPYRQIAEPGFKVSGEVKLVRGTVEYVNVIVMSERGWYAYRVADRSTPPGSTLYFEVDAGTMDVTGGRGGFVGKRLYAVAVSVGLSEDAYEENLDTVIGIGGLVIENGRSVHPVEPTIHETYVLTPRVYVLRKFQPTDGYLASIALLTVLLVSLAMLTAGVRGGVPVGHRLRW